MQKRTFRIITVSIIALSVALVSYAYLTSPTATLKNLFTVGRIEVPDIEEPNFPEDPELTPGTVVAKDPTITLKKNTTESYVYLAVKSYLTYEDTGELVDATTYYHGSTFETPAPGKIVDVGTKGFSTDWELVSTVPNVTNKSIMYVYRYKVTLSTTDSDLKVSPILFSAVGFDENLTAETLDLIAMVDGKQSIDVKGFVHQVVEDLTVAQIDTFVLDFFSDPTNWN